MKKFILLCLMILMGCSSTIVNNDFEIKRCTTLYEAVSIANKMTKKGDIVLFSPASSPLDSFRNYEERGEIFKELVKEIV